MWTDEKEEKERWRKKDHVKFVEARAEVQAGVIPHTEPQSLSHKPHYDNNRGVSEAGIKC